MSKKPLLNESTVRQFMKFANLGGLTDDFINEAYHMEEDEMEEAKRHVVGGQPGVARTIGGGGPAAQDFQAPFYGATTGGIYDYRNANKNTTVLWNVGGRYSGGANIYMVSGLWDSTAAVTSIALAMVTGPNFGRGSEFTLYGLNSS